MKSKTLKFFVHTFSVCLTIGATIAIPGRAAVNQPDVKPVAGELCVDGRLNGSIDSTTASFSALVNVVETPDLVKYHLSAYRPKLVLISPSTQYVVDGEPVQHIVYMNGGSSTFSVIAVGVDHGIGQPLEARLVSLSSSDFAARNPDLQLNIDPSPVRPAVPTGNLGQALLKTASQFMGVPYLYGGDTTSGIDCSAFIQTVFATNGISLPRTAAEQATVGTAIPTDDVSQWVPGDRIYFRYRHSYIDHVGMYIGNGCFIHSSATTRGVAVSRIDNPFWGDHIVAIRRSDRLAQDQDPPDPPHS